MSQCEQPNVLVMIADDQRFDMISALGTEAVETPNFDRLVESGCTVTRAHNMGSEHGAVCAPARAMLHSGLSLFHLNGPGNVTTDHPALPETFGRAGYRTFGTGKWHNGQAAFNRCFDEGRNVFFGGMDNHWNVPVTDRHPLDEYPDDRPHRFLPGDDRGPKPVRQTYERHSSGTHSSELFAETTVEFLTDHHVSGDDRPFFAYTAFMAPHDPRTAPGEFHALYDPADVELPANFRLEHPFDNGTLHIRDEDLAGHPRDPDEIRQHIADYYAMISHLDAQVGQVLNTLERTGQREDTIVVFTADHGLAVGQHGLLGKQNLYDHSVRVPLVFSGPGIPEDERRDVFSYHHDLYPTLADLTGLDSPSGIDGESLAGALVDGGDGSRDAVFTAYADEQRALRTDQYALVEYFVDGERHTQLFDVDKDPWQTENLAEDPVHADDLSRLRVDLKDWRERVDDPMLTE
ncbi:sulfatase-like hydrolase/transferase [Halomontanus rarus]|uniref:sulfatase-like hydrolase/transferase n=1 Tax=Halomontanus rarus TaxID=3034020 RepID=UPI0023E856E7|nr:sulfatase-like hydrolase/transferase [Halovivax sp. TS33]